MVLPAALEATALLLPPIYLILLYKVSFVTTGLLLFLCSCFELHPIFKGKVLASVFAIVLAGVLVPALALDGDDVHTDELLSPFVRVFSQVLIVCHTAVEGTCKFVDNDIDHCSIRYFGVGV